ncbi:hypothetical protein TrST_g6194 [Triparma strigata]|uniref:Uncharacterized protein n=1 Tax=Triparma strigata TaxID=1606541 RepID=A0A9W7ES52_9STRA|nr:hypothetical protein TrST_g6194 [Triparma strigata]
MRIRSAIRSLAVATVLLALTLTPAEAYNPFNGLINPAPLTSMEPRRTFVKRIAATTGAALTFGRAEGARADAQEEPTVDFEAIKAKAAELSSRAEAIKTTERTAASGSAGAGIENYGGGKTIYDFNVTIAGKVVPMKEVLGVKEVEEDVEVETTVEEVDAESGEKVSKLMKESKKEKKEIKPKAVLFVNIKQDDPQARKNIPQLISLAAKHGPEGLMVVCIPTDQGYYEPDTSALLRLKLASEYGYGVNPATVLTDKLNLLGSGAHPMMRWMESTSRTPAGLGRIELNFEKFLVDGQTGLPVRRYPRKYQPVDIEDDINALLQGAKEIPPARANFLEEWRDAQREADISEYAFKKGLNYYDQ